MSEALVPAIAPPAEIALEPPELREARRAPRSEALVRDRPHVVVVGAGFAGLHSIRALSGTEVSVTVIDRHNYHLFQPLLYQVATAALEPADISGQLRQVIRGSNVEILMCEVEGIDAERNRLELADRTIDFDYLILATGSSHSYFGHPEWAKRAPGLKTLEDALEIRRRVLIAFEEAEREPDPGRRESWLTFVVIGGGPTGVELAGAIAEISRQDKQHDFRNIDPRQARVILLEGRARVLMEYPEPLSAAAQRSLERLGVEVRTSSMVTEITEQEVKTESLSIAAQTVLWAAGVASSPVASSLARTRGRGAEVLDRAGRVRVTPQLSVPGLDNIYVVGDLALLEQDGQPLPGLAPVAIAEGKHAAANVLRAVRGESQQPFRYDDRGSFAVIGRGAAVGIAWRWRLSGTLAWLAWLAIHITFLVGFRNRIAVLFNWAYVYVTRRRHAELIIGAVPLPSSTPARDSDGNGRSARHSDTFERA